MKHFYTTLIALAMATTSFATLAQEVEEPNEVTTDASIITTPPAGEVHYYNRVGSALMMNSNSRVDETVQTGQMEVVYGED